MITWFNEKTFDQFRDFMALFADLSNNETLLAQLQVHK